MMARMTKRRNLKNPTLLVVKSCLNLRMKKMREMKKKMALTA
jgi:hypothetical protein